MLKNPYISLRIIRQGLVAFHKNIYHIYYIPDPVSSINMYKVSVYFVQAMDQDLLQLQALFVQEELESSIMKHICCC